MKIVMNALSARQGGGQTYIKNLLKNLPSDEDFELLIFAPPSLALPVDSRVRRKVPSWPTENPIFRAVWEIVALPRFLKKENADVLFCPGGLIVRSPGGNCATVTMFRNMLPFDPRALAQMRFGLQKIRNRLLRMLLISSLRKADLSIFISEYAREFVEALTSISNAVVIPHGIGEGFLQPGGPDFSLMEKLEEPYLLYVSRFDGYKHHAEVIEAFANLHGDLKGRYKLVFVGELDGIFSEKSKQLIERHNLTDRIVLLGPISYDELPAIYKGAYAAIFASSCENCPNILLESLGSGCAVLCSDVQPMPEFAKDAVEYFSPFDSKSISVAMTNILLNPARRDELRKRAVERSREFDWRKSARLTWSVIFSLKKNVEARHAC